MIDILNPEVSDTDIKQIVPPKKLYIMLLNLILCIDIWYLNESIFLKTFNNNDNDNNNVFINI